MKKILLIDSTYPINTRTNKIFKSLINEFGENNVFVIAWNRDGREIQNNQNYYIFNKNAAYGNKIQKLFNLFSFKKYIKKVLKNNQFDVIIASHWETLMLSAQLKTNDKKLIYENLDLPTSYNKAILKILQRIEKMSLKKTDAIVFASRFFVPLYNSFKKEKFLLENKPDKDIPILNCDPHESFNIVFLGIIRYFDILKNLIDAIVELPNVNLYIWGEGPDYHKIKSYSDNKENIFVNGRYDNSQLSDIYKNADCVWAVYPNKDYNVKYAISNKFHESINLGRPCIYADKTELGNFVNSKGIGFIVNPYSVSDIKELLKKLSANKIVMKEAVKNLNLLKETESSWDEDIKKLIMYINS